MITLLPFVIFAGHGNALKSQIWHALKYKTESTLFVNSLNSLTEALANYNIYSEHSKLLFGEANQLALFDSCPSSL